MPFFGREAELAALARTAARVSGDGRPAAAFVTGDPGTGKTRLIAEAVARAGAERPLRIVGYEAEQEVPLAAASGLLRALTEVEEHGDRLDAVAFGSPAEASPLEPVRVFEAAHRALRALGPQVVVVDDVQWIDDLSLALCEYLVRAAADGDQPLVALAATRPSANAGVLVDALTRTLGGERVTTIELGPLGAEDGIALVRDLAGDLDSEAARRIWERAAGSPFWLEALARSGGDERDAAQLVTARARSASPDATALLALLVVAGLPLDVDDVAALLEWPHARSEHAALQLAQRGIVVVERGRVRLAHDLIRAAAADDVPADLARRLHRAVARQLEEEASDDLLLLRRALEHRRAGGLPAVDLAGRLAGSPRRTLLGRHGLELLSGIADDAPRSSPNVLELDENLAELASELGLHELALRRWLLLAEHASDPGRTAAALVGATTSSYELGRPDEARDYLARARAVTVDDEALQLDLDVHQAAIELWLEQRTELGRALAQDARHRAHALLARAGTVDALDARARRSYMAALRVAHEAAMQSEDLSEMLRAAEEWAAAARGWDESAYLTASVRGGVALGFQARLPEAEERARQAWVEAQRRVLPRAALDAGYWLGRFVLDQGRVLEAEAIARDVTELAVRVGDVPRGRNRVTRLACNVALHRGDPAAGMRRLEQVADDEPSLHMRIGLLQDLALWQARLGGPGEAGRVSATLGEAHRQADVVRCPRCSAELLLMSAEAEARTGRLDEARESLARWEEAQARPKPNEPLLRSRIAGLLHAAAGDSDAAVVELEAADSGARGMQLVLEARWTQIDLADALGRIDRRRAADVLREAAAAAADGGAGTQQAVAEQRLRALGVRTWRRGRATGSGDGDAFAALTAREREVAALAAGGASNPEIAQALFLSRKTVERHMSNALAKLGARNRAELAAMLGDATRTPPTEPPTEGAPR